jgi:cell division protein FtsW
VLITIAFGAAFWMAGVPLSWVMLLGARRSRAQSTYFLFPHVASRVDRFLSPDKADTHQVDRAAEAISAGGCSARAGGGRHEAHVPDCTPTSSIRWARRSTA